MPTSTAFLLLTKHLTVICQWWETVFGFHCNALAQTCETTTACYSRELLPIAKSHATQCLFFFSSGQSGMFFLLWKKNSKNEVMVGSRPPCLWSRYSGDLHIPYSGNFIIPAAQIHESGNPDFTPLSDSLLNVWG